MSATVQQTGTSQTDEHKIKCVVWDLDNTVWDGILLEDTQVRLRPNVVETIRTLDSRGILNSIASRNDERQAMTKLKELGIDHYFIYPQIHWHNKAASVRNISKLINIGIDTLAFVDDQPFEREEVAFSAPEVLCIDAADVDTLVDMPEMNPRFITDESKIRREMYQSDIRRNHVEETHDGPQEAFLEALDMQFSIAPASHEDLKRAEELTVRTHQLNTTGYTYNYDELDAFRKSDHHRLYVASLVDKYGTYGKIGLVLIETDPDLWVIKLLLMSCRVMSRGVGTILINQIRHEAKAHGVRLQAEFISTDVNRMMYMTYKFAGFEEVGPKGDLMVLENNLAEIPPHPAYVKVTARL